MTEQILLYAMLGLSTFHGDPDRSHHVRIAEAVSRATQKPTEAAALLSIAWHESRFARYVVEHRCSDGPIGAQCDPDKQGRPRATSPWQVWSWCEAAWQNPGSQESTNAAAKCALRQWKSSLRRCHKGYVGAFSGYKAIPCFQPWARKRVRTMQLLLNRIQMNRSENK